MDAVHGDLKLENVMVLEQPPDTVKLVDFGLSSFNAEASLAPVGDHYLAPEDLQEGAVVAKASEVRAERPIRNGVHP